MAAVPALAAFPRWSFAAGEALGRDRLMYIYLRGGADGLTLCPPVGDPHYFDLRPTLAVPEAEVLPLDAMFGLHPAAQGLKTLYDAGELAVVHACGLATAQRSHFEAQSATEQGIDAADPAFGTGWAGRYLNGIEVASPLAAIALDAAVPQALAGSAVALAMASVDDFGLSLPSDLLSVLGAMYGGHVIGDWPGLDGAALSAGEDLAVTTDYRQVLAELLAHRLGVADLASVFGDWQPEPWQGIFLPRAA